MTSDIKKKLMTPMTPPSPRGVGGVPKGVRRKRRA